jgi:ketosteroid isomerase-like protein
MSSDQEAAEFVDNYGKFWQDWDVEGFVDLFIDDVVYVAHPEEIVLGKEALEVYLEKEQTAQGEVSVLMGRPMVDGDQVFGEFWVTATSQDEKASIAGCLVARLDGPDGRCTHFREYWFDLEGHCEPFEGWGR